MPPALLAQLEALAKYRGMTNPNLILSADPKLGRPYQRRKMPYYLRVVETDSPAS